MAGGDWAPAAGHGHASPAGGQHNQQKQVTADQRAQQATAAGAHPADGEPASEADVRVQDSSYSWVVVAGAALQFMLLGGVYRSFGLLLAALSQQRGYSATAVSFISAICMAASFLVAPVCGALCRCYSERCVAVAGCALTSLGLILSSFTTSIHVLYVTSGLLFGLGQGFGATTGTLIVTHYSERRRGLANAVISAAGAVGGIFFPLLVQAMLEENGIGGTYLLLGALYLNSLIAAALYRPLPLQAHIVWLGVLRRRRRRSRSHTATDGHSVQTAAALSGGPVALAAADAVPLVADTVAKAAASPASSRSSLAASDGGPASRRSSAASSQPPLRHRRAGATLTSSTAMLSQLSLAEVADEDEPTRPAEGCGAALARLFDFRLLSEPLYLTCIGGVLLFAAGLPHVVMLVPRFGLEIGVSRARTAVMIATVAPVDIAGRLALGVLLDRNLFHKRYGFLIASWVGAVGVLALAFVRSYAGLYVACVLVYASVGFFMLVMPVLYAEYYGVRRLSSTLTLSNTALGVANLVVQPLCGVLRDAAGSFRPVFAVLSVCLLGAGATVLLHPRLLDRSKRSRSELNSGAVSSS